MSESIHSQREGPSSDIDKLPISSTSFSRRKLLSTLGAAGLALATGDIFINSRTAQAAASSTPIYNVKDFGARGNRRYDEDDAPFIQNAIDSAALSGGIVFIPPGMYYLRMPLRVSSNVTLMGSGSNSILRASTNKFGLLNLSAVNHVHIHRLSFQGIGSFGTTNIPLIECGIALEQASDIRVTDCTFSMIDNGVKSVDSSRVVVESCTFDNIIGTLDYDSQGYGIWCSNAKDHHLVQNQFTMMFQTCITLTNGSSHSVITKNRMHKCYQAGIDLISGPKEEPCKFNTLSDNILDGFVNSSGNTGYTVGIRLKGNCVSNVITGNILSDIDDIAIKLMGQDDVKKERPHFNTISNNQILTIRDNGIVLVNAHDNQISNNTIRDCKVDGILLSADGIKNRSFCDSNQITGNSLNNCGKSPIRIADANCRETIIFGNIGTGNGEKITDKGTNTITSTL